MNMAPAPNTWANKDSKSLDVRISNKNRENKTAHIGNQTNIPIVYKISTGHLFSENTASYSYHQ